MPFVHNDELYISYMLAPVHIVLHCKCPQQPLDIAYQTDSNLITQAMPAGSKIHGGPPPVLVPASTSTTGISYYLGVLHLRQDVPSLGIRMPHYFYIMEAAPPFTIKALSPRQVPLKVLPDKAGFSFVSGMILDAGQESVLISYGASDSASYVLRLTVKELEAKFFGWL